MNRNLFFDFCKDNSGFSISFYVNSAIITIFYYITTGSRVELVYPVLLSTYVFGIFMLIRWIKYYKFNSKLERCIEDINYKLLPTNREQHATSRIIEKIQKINMEKISSIQLENNRNKHFISQWIHNMKTPVSIIDIMLQKIKTGEVTADKALEDINVENQRLFFNLEQILNIIRLDDFSRDYIPERVDLAVSLFKVINSKKNQFVYNKVFPKLESINEEIFILSDAKWNEVILDQLISNAIKYSGNGKDPKNVYFNIEKQNGLISLKIKDKGVGIPDYDIKRVFDPFFTGENGRNQDNSSGIGLYICAVIAEKLGHEIHINSQKGHGTEVTITYLSKM